MKKRILSLLLALVMVLSVALPAQAADAETTTWEAADFTYGEISQDLYPATETTNITTYSGIGITGFSESGLEKFATNPNVVLPSEDTEGNKIVGVGTYAFDAKGIESVKLPDDAKDWIISNYAFRKNNLTSVDLSGVVYVGLYAFQTNKLTSVKFDENIWWIYSGAFAKNEISTLEFPAKTDKPLNVDMQAFFSNQLTTVNIPSNTEKLNQYAFMMNTGVTPVTAGNANEKKGGVVFMYTDDLSTWDQPYITYIGNGSNVQRLIYNGPVTEAEGRTYASGADALAAVKAGTGVIIDLRATEKTDNLYLADAFKQPLFAPGVTNLKDQLAFDFVAFANGNADLKDKDIYVLCNAGAKGADAATRLLLSVGYAMEDIITITGGATSNDIIAAFEVRQTKTTGESRNVTGTQAVSVIENTAEYAIIDVRAAEKHAVGHLKNSVSLPLFTLNETGGNVAITDYKGELATAFTNYVTDNAETLKAKQIYILCNSGATGAKNAAKLLYLAGYDLDNVYTITGGAKGTEEDMSVPNNLKFVTGAQAVSVIENTTEYAIIDVRAAAKYAVGHLKNSVNLPLFTLNETGGNVAVQAPYEDELSQNFLAYVNDNKEALAAKTIYIVCNSGQTGVKNALALMEKAGLTTNVFGISGGAKGLATDMSVPNNLKFVTGAQAVSVIEDKTNYKIIDVRAAEKYAVGHLKNSVSLPLFTINPETGGNVPVAAPYEDELSQAFLAYVNEHKEALAAQTIYIVCNSGQTGVKNALALMEKAGLTTNVFGISGGAKGLATDMSVPNNLKFVTDAHVLSVLDKENTLVLDVRAKEKYDAGHIEGSLSLPLFTIDPVTGGNSPVAAPYEDELSQAFLTYAKENKDVLAAKTIYILCNSGQTGAKNAFVLLEQAGLTSNVFAISGGATNESLQDIFVKTEEPVEPEKPVEPIKIKSALLSYKNLVYTGKSVIPAVNIKDVNGTKLVKGTDFTVAIYNANGKKVTSPKAVGKYTIKVTYIGKYEGNDQSVLTYAIVPKAVTNLKASLVPDKGYNNVKLTWTKSTGATGYYVYYKKSTTASYKSYKYVTGNTVTLKNLATGTKYNFKVVPCYGTNKAKSFKFTTINKTTLKKVVGVKVTRNGKKVKVSWTNINGETGYQISRANKKAATANIKTFAGANLKTKTITLSTAKKHYYKVRAYKVENGKKVFGPWSAVEYK